MGRYDKNGFINAAAASVSDFSAQVDGVSSCVAGCVSDFKVQDEGERRRP